MNTRHIAFLISDMGAGGAQRVASILCNQWVLKGYKISVVTFESDDARSFYDLDARIDYHYLNLMNTSRNPIDAIIFNIKRILNVRRCLKDLSPDLVVSFMSESNVIGTLSALGLDMPIVVSERSNPDVVPQSRFWRVLRRIIYPLSNMVVCQTQYAQRFFSFHKHAVVIPNPVLTPKNDAHYTATHAKNPEHFDTYQLMSNHPFIGALGRLGHEKGFDVLIDAFAKIADRISDHHLIIVGEGSARSKLENKIREYGLEHRIHLIGQVENPFHILYQSALFVMPSRFEGFPNALCEAMVHGLPVIASDQATQHLSMIENGVNAIVVSSDDSDQLSNKIVTIIEDPQMLSALGQQARKIQDYVSVQTVMKQWESCLSLYMRD